MLCQYRFVKLRGRKKAKKLNTQYFKQLERDRKTPVFVLMIS